MKIKFPLNVQPGKWVLEMNNLGKSYGDLLLFKGINLTVGRGEKIALLGPNGVGKSTLLKRIMKTLDGEGVVNYGHNVKVTYFAQDQADQLNKEKTVYETVDDVAKGEIRKELRSVLGAFLFSGEDVDKKVSVLSGGERTRLALCQLLLSPSNVLILDEPTNHLDIQSKDVLKQALKNYEGTFIVVSHDREFLDGLTNRIWDIENKELKIHHFSVKEYLKRKSEQKPKNQETKQIKEPSSNKDKDKSEKSYAEKKELKRKLTKCKNAIVKWEKEISQLEAKKKEMDGVIAELDYSNEEEAEKQLKVYAQIEKDLELALEKWEETTNELAALDEG